HRRSPAQLREGARAGDQPRAAAEARPRGVPRRRHRLQPRPRHSVPCARGRRGDRRDGGRLKHLFAIVLLPGTVAVVIPALILSFEGVNIRPATAVLGACAIAAGLGLVAWTIALFVRLGRGTLAPWDPTSRLVVQGPYSYVRNPMITGVGTILAGEA